MVAHWGQNCASPFGSETRSEKSGVSPKGLTNLRVVHSTARTGLYISISKPPKQHTALETLILSWYISKIKYTLYSPPPKLEIAGPSQRWVAFLIRDINNVTFPGSTGLLMFEWDPGERAVCSNCWIFPAQNASKHIKKNTHKKTLSQWKWDMATLETLWSRLLAGAYLWGSCLGAGGGGWGPPWPSVWELLWHQMSSRTCHSYTPMSQVCIVFLIIVFTFLSSREFFYSNLNFDIRAKIWER